MVAGERNACSIAKSGLRSVKPFRRFSAQELLRARQLIGEIVGGPVVVGRDLTVQVDARTLVAGVGFGNFLRPDAEPACLLTVAR